MNFNGIPADLLTPGQYIEFDPSRAVRGLPVLHQRILVFGQKLATGTAPVLTPLRVLSSGEAELAFGRGSLLADTLTALLAANRTTQTFAVALNEPAGVAATGRFAFEGTPTSDALLNLYLGGVRVQVSVRAGMTAAQVATAATTAINAHTALPITAAAVIDEGNDEFACEITFRHTGALGNAYDLRVNYNFGERSPTGLTVAVVPMTSGVGDPDLAAAIAALGDVQYHTWIVPYTDGVNLTAVETELMKRWGPLVQTEGQAFSALRGTVNEVTAISSTRNSPHLTLLATGASPTAPWIWAAVMGAIDAFEPDPARPRQTLALPGCLAPLEGARFNREQRNLLLRAGASTYVVDAGGTVRIERLVTTYRFNDAGEPDTAYQDIETMRTLAYLRISVRARIALRFPRHKLADDGTLYAPGQAVATPSEIRAELLHLAREWESAGLVEDFDQFAANLIVERDANDPDRVNSMLPPNTVNQLRIFAAAIQFIR